MPRLAGKTTIVTGGASGIGQAIVRLFVSEGTNVGISDVQTEAGMALAAELGPAARFFAHDVSKSDQWERVAAEVEGAFGPIEVLVNNAGISGKSRPIDEISEDDYRRLIEINQLGTFLGMKAVLPSMRRAGGGSIVNTSSTYGLVAAPCQVDYCAAKFAVTGMTKAAAMDLGQYNIRVNVVHPGPTRTPMTEKSMQALNLDFDQLAAALPLGKWANPMELAQMYLFLASPEASFCTGASFIVDGGQTAQ